MGGFGDEGGEGNVAPLEEGGRLDGAVAVDDAADGDADRVEVVGRARPARKVGDRADDTDGGEGLEGDLVGVARGRLQVDDGSVEGAVCQLDAEEIVRGGDDVEGDRGAAGGSLGGLGDLGEEAGSDEFR